MDEALVYASSKNLILFYNDLFLFFSFVFLSFCFVLFFVGSQFSFYVLLCVVIFLYFLLFLFFLFFFLDKVLFLFNFYCSL